MNKWECPIYLHMCKVMYLHQNPGVGKAASSARMHARSAAHMRMMGHVRNPIMQGSLRQERRRVT